MTETTPLLTKEQTIAIILAAPREKEPTINTALFIVTSAFHGKTTWDGGDYIAHCLHVGLTDTSSHDKMAAGIMHDLLEDSDWTADDLRRVGFSERIVKMVVSVTRNEDESYFDFVRRCSCNPDGIDLKLKDLDHNTRGARQTGFPSEKKLHKQRAYIVAYRYLLSVKKGETAPGSSIGLFMRKHPELRDWNLLVDFSKTTPPAPPAPVLAIQMRAPGL